MRKFLIPLLAFIAWPANVNAEILRLKCGSTEFNINEQAGKVVVQTSEGRISKTNKLFASSDYFIIEFKDDIFRKEFQINRTDGTYQWKMWTMMGSDEMMAELRKVTLEDISNEKREAAKTYFRETPCTKIKEKKKLF